jgi:hypothetical protein
MPTSPSYEESSTPNLPGLFMRTDQLDAVVQVRRWSYYRGSAGDLFNGSAGTGVLIGPRLVLTAKHVVAERTAERANADPATIFDVVFGADKFTTDPSLIVPVYGVEAINPGVPIGAAGLTRDSAFGDFLSVSHDDLALLFLSRVAPASPIPLAPSEPTIGQRLQLSGFGQMALDSAQRGWAQGTVTHFSNDRSGFFVRSTGSSEADTAPGPGDSGGPAISVSPAGSPQVSGVVSGGKWLFPELERTRMEMYASVAPHRDWLDAASSRLIAEDWQHDVGRTAGGTSSSSVLPWVIGGAAVIGLVALLASGGKGR